MRPQPIGVARVLHDGPIRHDCVAHEESDTDDALVADHGDFGRCAILQRIEQRHDGGRGEIDVTQLVPGLVKNVVERHLDQFQMGRQVL